MGKIENVARELLGDSITLPVPIEAIVESKGIRLLPYDFKEDISGILILENGEAIIGYNKNHHRLRNRFTIAHELGHFLLHKDKDLFVDKDFKVLFRSSSTNGIHERHEIEANEFAANILMPSHLLTQEFENRDIDYTDEDLIKTLAKKFDVSTTAMSIRISRLNLFNQPAH